MEIERKYLIGRLPFDLAAYDCYVIEQAYISTMPVIRIRKRLVVQNKTGHNKTPEAYILTIKSSGLMSREEYELQLTPEEYSKLKEKVSGNSIIKRRYVIPIENGLRLELDVFFGDFDGLVVGEIEFPDEETAQKFNPPEYLVREVTFDNRYHNSSLSTMDKADIPSLFN